MEGKRCYELDGKPFEALSHMCKIAIDDRENFSIIGYYFALIGICNKKSMINKK